MLTAKKIENIEKRFNQIRPDYNIHFGLGIAGEGYELCDFNVDDKGRVTMEINELYLNNQYALRYRYHTRHPKLTAEEIKYLLSE